MTAKKRPHASRKPVTDRKKEQRLEECAEALEEVLRERLERGASFRDYDRTLLDIAHEVVPSGQRWSQCGLSSALHLRAICDSERFDHFWPFFAARYRARHVVALGHDPHWS